MLDKGDIDQRAVDKFYNGVGGFYGQACNYCVKWLKLDHPFVKNCQFADFNKRNEMSFSNIEQIIPFFSNVSSKIEKFPELHNETEKQFLEYQAMTENDISSSTWKAAEIRDEKSYVMEAIWGYMRAKLPLLSKIALCVLVVPHSNAGEERIFSIIRKNKTDFRSRLQLDGSLNSIMRIKMSISESLTACHKWKSSPSLFKACKQATKAYNDLNKSEN